MANTVNEAKQLFLERYNPKRDINTAVSKAISASVQHNSLYKTGLGNNEKKVFRKAWKEFLISTSNEYKSSLSIDTFKHHVEELVNHMNENFSHLFREEPHPRYNYDPGFRVSHGQKSLSVFLKHCWCLDRVKEPPVCPVDRIILKHIGASLNKSKWTHINSLDSYQKQLNLIIKEAEKENISVAKYELLSF